MQVAPPPLPRQKQRRRRRGRPVLLPEVPRRRPHPLRPVRTQPALNPPRQVARGKGQGAKQGRPRRKVKGKQVHLCETFPRKCFYFVYRSPEVALTVGGVGSFGGDDKIIFKVDQFMFPQHAVCLRLGKNM